MDLSKLSDEQVKVAIKVIESAEKHGLNPDFVLPMVNVESGFDPKAKSKAGAIGVMQLMPDTAKDLKVDPNNLEENIDGGMRYLKSLVENKRFGGDPEKVFAAYNAGPNHKFFETQNMADLPDETIKHVVKIFDQYGDKAPSMTLSKPEEKAAEPEPIKLDGENPYGKDVLPTWDQSKEEQEARRMLSGTLGSAAGSTLGTVYAAKAPIVRMAQRVGLLPGGKPIAPSDAAQLVEKAMTAPIKPTAPTTPKSGGENWVKALTKVDIPGGQMSKADLDLAKGMQTTVGIRGEPGFVGGQITPGGIILGPDLKNKPAPPPAPPRVPQPGPISTGAASVLGSSPVRGGLVGFNLGYGGQDVYNRMANRDYLGAGISGAGMLGDVMSLVPTAAKLGPRLAPLGGALSASADVARRAREQDYIGALTSAVGAAAPYVAPFALGPEVGIPVGVATALGAPIANEIREYLQKGGDQTPEPKKAFRYRGVGLD